MTDYIVGAAQRFTRLGSCGLESCSSSRSNCSMPISQCQRRPAARPSSHHPPSPPGDKENMKQNKVGARKQTRAWTGTRTTRGEGVWRNQGTGSGRVIGKRPDGRDGRPGLVDGGSWRLRVYLTLSVCRVLAVSHVLRLFDLFAVLVPELDNDYRAPALSAIYTCNSSLPL